MLPGEASREGLGQTRDGGWPRRRTLRQRTGAMAQPSRSKIHGHDPARLPPFHAAGAVSPVGRSGPGS